MDQIMTVMDVFPTLAEAAGLKPEIQGHWMGAAYGHLLSKVKKLPGRSTCFLPLKLRSMGTLT